MVNRTYKVTKASGFTLIEALIALAVFSFGLLAVAKFQAALVTQSGQSKARSEAVQLAQQKIDQIRNYTTEPQLVSNLLAKTIDTADEFSTELPTVAAPYLPIVATTYPATPETIEGSNTDFSRQWDVLCTGDVCSVSVSVSWFDTTTGQQQTASLDTNVTWKDPRGTADLTVNEFTPAVPSATGRAYLGDGTVTEAELDAGTDNLDGTVSITDVGDDRVLVDETANADGTYNIVLTLEDACKDFSGTDCIDFVKISGRVYKDLVDDPTVALADVFVLASDAAYCARNFDPLSLPTTSPNANYEYYDYTCYLGGGWHGNIGVLLNDGGNQDRVCLGDPDSLPDDGVGDNNWRQMELASRRVYRGMTFIGDASTGVLPPGTLYYSQGIGDAVVLPDPGDYDAADVLIANTDFRYYGHNFVITNISGNPTAVDCEESLTRPDTDTDGDGADLVNGEMGDLFYGVSTDFVCLNEERVSGTFKYLDTLKTGHWAKDFCPYDPSRGPALAYYVSGTVSVPAPDVLDGTAIANSVNADNCAFVDNLTDLNIIDITGMNSATYACLVYDWGDGWTGSVYVDEGFGLFCDPAISFDAITGDQLGQDFDCVTLAQPTISGTLTAYMNNLTGITVEAVRENADGTQETIDCGAPTMSASGDTAEWGCTVEEEELDVGWVGAVNVGNLPADITCDETSWLGTETATTPLTTDSPDNDTYCYGVSGTTVQSTVTGYFSSNLSMEGLTLPTITGGGDVSGCTAPELLSTILAKYTCTVSFAYDSTTGGTGSVTVGDSGSALSCTDTFHTVSGVTADYTIPTETSCTVDLSGAVTIEGRIYDLVTPLVEDGFPDGVFIDGAQGYAALLDDLDNVVGSCTAGWADMVYSDGDINNYSYQCTTFASLSPGDKWNGKVRVFPLAPNIMCTAEVSFDKLRPSAVITQDFAVSPDEATCTANGF